MDPKKRLIRGSGNNRTGDIMNRRRSAARFALLLGVISTHILGGCGAGLNSSQSAAQPTSGTLMAVLPGSISVQPGSSQQFTVQVGYGGAAPSVSWSLASPGCSGAGCGFIDASGNYTAPSSPVADAIKITATSLANPAVVANAEVIVTQSSAANCDSSVLWGGDRVAAIAKNISRFTPTGSMTQPRGGHSATLLPNGKVLIVNGGQLDIDDLLVPINSAEVFDPSQGTFTTTGAPCRTREFHTATLLANGKVLIAGGTNFNGYPTWLPSTATSELYDPAAGTFTATGNMSVGRTNHTATLLPDGRVLIAGGSTSIGSGTSTTTQILASTEIYNPGTGTFSPGGDMSSPRAGQTATMLPSGKVLIVGGQNNQGALATSELYDPQTNSFVPSGSMSGPRTGHTSTLLTNGKVLVVGGGSAGNLTPGEIAAASPWLATAELYDPNTNTFAITGSMHDARIAHTASLLSDGTVLVIGGFKDYVGSPTWLGYESLDSAEIYDPATASFSATGPMNTTRFWQTATVLPDGAVLVTGGVGSDLTRASTEIFK